MQGWHVAMVALDTQIQIATPTSTIPTASQEFDSICNKCSIPEVEQITDAVDDINHDELVLEGDIAVMETSTDTSNCIYTV
uniref:Uncharacterized protein n=1 Tax=Romanomermis culicivorax TaxID=13658 RepID=A0A915JJG6_ROMCU